MREESYLDTFRREFLRLKQLSDAALAQLKDEQFFSTAGNGDNSIAILMKHMSGNMLSRWRNFLTADGEKPDRDRDSEFVIAETDTRQSLGDRWERGWQCLFDALDPLQEEDTPGKLSS
jgi:hypothetical protein